MVSSQAPAQSTQIRALRAVPSWVLDTSRDKDPAASLGNLIFDQPHP